MRSSYCEGNTLQLVKDSCYTPIAMVIVPVLLKASSLTGLGLAVDLSVVSQAVMDVVCTWDRQPGGRGWVWHVHGVWMSVHGMYVGRGWVWHVCGAWMGVACTWAWMGVAYMWGMDGCGMYVGVDGCGMYMGHGWVWHVRGRGWVWHVHGAWMGVVCTWGVDGCVCGMRRIFCG